MITYNGIISYFKEFADKHLQINSFSEGTADKIDLDKINQYPLLHLDITGTDIQHQTIIYNMDVYVLTGANNQDDKQRITALSETLMILQDLRAEFFDGRLVVPKLILLSGSEELSCTPIQEDFKNSVYGWSTSMSVTGVNEATRCTIPYPLSTNLIEQWEGRKWIKPFETDIFDSFYWWSANDWVQSNLTYVGTKIHTIGDIKHSNWLSALNLTSNHSAQTTGIQYNEENQAFRFSGVGGQYYLLASINTTTERYYHFAVKVKNIKSQDAKNTALFSIFNLDTTEGIKVFIGSPTSSTTAIRNRICLSNADESSISIGEDITDGSGEYIREESLTFGLQVGGDDVSSVVKLILDGRVLLTQTIATAELKIFLIGNGGDGNTDTCLYDLQEVVAHKIQGMADHIDEFINVVDWLKYR